MQADLDRHRQISRRQVVAGLASATLIPGAVSASSGSNLRDIAVDAARELARGRNVELRLLLPIGSGANIEPIVTAFTHETGIQVRATEIPADEIFTELYLQGLSQTQQFDAALPATFGVPDLASSNVIRPLSEYVQRYEPKDFRVGSLYTVGDSFDGETYGFQTDGDVYMMFYNKMMMENADNQARYADTFGDALTIPDTWSQLDQQIGFFNDPDNGVWGGLLFRTSGYLAWCWWMRFHSKGIWPFSPEMEPQINSDAGVEALEDMIKVTEHLMPDVKSLGLFANWERFSRGDIFCNFGWGGTQKYLNKPGSNMRGNLLFGSTPGALHNGKAVKMPYFNWGWNYVVTASSKEPEIAYLFALFARSPQISTISVRQVDGFFDPYRLEHYDDPAIQDAYSKEFLQVHRNSMMNAFPDLYLKGQAEYFRVLGDELAKALRKEISPKHALERISQHWQTVTNGIGRPEQLVRWNQLRAKYPAAMRAYLRDLS